MITGKFEYHDELHGKAPILRATALQIADLHVRYMGTIGGNIVNGDPANDMPELSSAWINFLAARP